FRQGETGYGVTHLVGHLRQVTNAPRGGGGTRRGLRGDLLNDVHGVGNVSSRGGLLPGCVGNVLNQRREALGYLLDLFQGDTGILCQAGAAYHFRSGLLQRDDRLVGIGLNLPDQCPDLPGRRGRSSSKALDFVGNHREASSGVAGHGSLDGRVQCKDVGLVGDVVDQADDVTNLLRRLTKTLDPLGGVLDLLANVVHAGDGVVHHLVALVGDGYRTLRYRRGFGGVRRYLVDRHGHFVDCRRSPGNFLRLMLGRLGQMHGGRLRFLRRTGHLNRSPVDGADEIAQLVVGVVDRVGDSAGEVFGYRRGHGQVTVGQVTDLVEQTQNGRLVTLVLLGCFAQAGSRFTDHDHTDENDRGQGQGAEHIAQQRIQVTRIGTSLQPLCQRGCLVEQCLRNFEDTVGRFTHLEQLGRGFENLIHRAGHELEQLGDCGQTIQRFLVAHARDAHGLVAFLHGTQNPAEQTGIATEHVGSLYRVLITGKYLVDRTENTFRQQGLTLRHGNLHRRRRALQQNVDDFLVLDLQLRNGFGKRGRYLVQGKHGLLAGEDRIGVLPQRVPVLLYRTHLGLQRIRHCRQADRRIALGEIGPALTELVPRGFQRSERPAGTGGRFHGVLRDTLRQNPQLTRVADVFVVVIGLRTDVCEVCKQQHHRDEQDDEQPNDQRIATHPGQQCICIHFFHYLAPAWTAPTFSFKNQKAGISQPHLHQ